MLPHVQITFVGVHTCRVMAPVVASEADLESNCTQLPRLATILIAVQSSHKVSLAKPVPYPLRPVSWAVARMLHADSGAEVLPPWYCRRREN